MGSICGCKAGCFSPKSITKKKKRVALFLSSQESSQNLSYSLDSLNYFKQQSTVCGRPTNRIDDLKKKKKKRKR